MTARILATVNDIAATVDEINATLDRMLADERESHAALMAEVGGER